MSYFVDCNARGCVYGYLPDLTLCSECNGTGKILVREQKEKSRRKRRGWTIGEAAWGLICGAAIAYILGKLWGIF